MRRSTRRSTAYSDCKAGPNTCGSPPTQADRRRSPLQYEGCWWRPAHTHLQSGGAVLWERDQHRYRRSGWEATSTRQDGGTGKPQGFEGCGAGRNILIKRPLLTRKRGSRHCRRRWRHATALFSSADDLLSKAPRNGQLDSHVTSGCSLPRTPAAKPTDTSSVNDASAARGWVGDLHQGSRCHVSSTKAPSNGRAPDLDKERVKFDGSA
ncbi:hypothetical protein ABIB82_006644 [Bradyrhizobium sp. i1.8.4]